MANTFNLGNGNWAQKTEKLLAYNAENDNYKPLPFDFDRGSTATRVNRDGLIETVATDEPRIDFLNNTKGHLLLEPSRANYLTNSDNGSTYSVFSATKTLDEQISPDGTLNSFTLTGNGDYNQILGQTPFFTLPSAGNYTFSAFAKKGNNNFIQLFFDGFSGASNIQAYFDLENGTTPTSGASIKNYGNGWYRCSFVGTVVSGDLYGKLGFRVSYGSTNFFFNNENDTIGKNAYFYGFQLEQGSYATSYIPTSGSAVTRSVDFTKIVNSPILQGTNQFTLFFDAKDFLIVNGTNTSFDNVMLVFGAGESAYDSGTGIHIYDRTWYYYNGSSAVNIGVCYNGLTDNKFAISYDGTKFTRYAGGIKLGEFVTSASMVNWDTITTGAMDDAQNDERNFNLSDLRLYNTALTDAELIALTS